MRADNSPEAIKKALKGVDLVLTSYGLLQRDSELLESIDWQGLVIDEAQAIKNPGTAQTKAIKQLPAAHRIALTGTPIENRLGDLWSIMEFCCPGYLGTQGDFRKRFALPVERHRDKRQADENGACHCCTDQCRHQFGGADGRHQVVDDRALDLAPQQAEAGVGKGIEIKVLPNRQRRALPVRGVAGRR